MNQVLATAATVCTNGVCEQKEVDASAIAGMLAFMGGFIAIFIVIGVLLFAFWIWMLIDAIGRSEESYKKIGSGEKTVWILALVLSTIIGLSWLATILYYFIVKKKGDPKKKSK